MTSIANESFEVLVIGAGPAGMAAAATAAECGARVGVVDDNSASGGQIWRAAHDHPEADYWNRRLAGARVAALFGTRVFHQPEPGVLLAERADQTCELRYEKLILATGARERFLPFPGWTLPNVMGAGGLQAMVKSGLPIKSRRIVVAGTGPLLLAVAAYLRKQGGHVLLICEQASWSRLIAFSLGLVNSPKKIAQALELRKELSGIPFAPNSWPVKASGSQRLESVTVKRGGKLEGLACDYLACGFHLVPNIELAALIGCEIREGLVHVNDFQKTSVDGVYCAGEPCGIAGVESALVQGQIAGLAAVGRAAEAMRLFRERRKTQLFGARLERAFRLRSELRELPAAETLVCRCEDVMFSCLREHASWRSAKLHTRCGMGPCQGRVCGTAAQFLFGWNPDSVRPPVFPARVESLASVHSGQ